MLLPTENAEQLSKMLATLTKEMSALEIKPEEQSENAPSIEEVTGVLENLTEVIYADSQAANDEKFGPNEATEFGEYAIYMVNGSSYMLKNANKTSLLQHNNILAIGLALWIGDHGGKINEPQALVDTMAELANQTTEPDDLTEMFHVLSKLINACSLTIKQDMDKSNMGRPWRVLNLNRCIVATRTQDTELMELAFSDLVTNLPEDAPNFFSQGINQVAQENYSDEVREVMQRYQEQNAPSQIVSLLKH